MSNANYTLLGLTKGAPISDVKRAYRKLLLELHPNKGGNKEEFQKVFSAYKRINQKANNDSKNAAAEITTLSANVINKYFRDLKKSQIVPKNGNNTNRQIVPYRNNTTRQIVPIVPKNGNNTTRQTVPKNGNNNVHGVGHANTRKTTRQNVPTSGQPPARSFWNPFTGISRRGLPPRINTRQNVPTSGQPPARSFWNPFKGIFRRGLPPPVRWIGINHGFIPSNTFKGRKPGYVFKTNQYGTGYYPNFFGPVQKNMGTGPVQKNTGTGPVQKNTGTGPVQKNTGIGTRIGNVTSTSGSSQSEGGRGGSSQSEGGRGGSSQSEGGRGGSINFAPVIKVNIPQAAAQSAVQSLPLRERLALNNAGGYQNAAAAVSNAGGPVRIERAINALNANGGNINIAIQETGLPRQVFNNVKKLGGPITARRTLTAVKNVTLKTAPYVGQNVTQRVAPNVYALTPVKRHRKKRMDVKLSELNRVINAVKKKKLTSLVAHNVTRTNIHANNARLKSYYKRVIKSAILKRPFAKIARDRAKKLFR